MRIVLLGPPGAGKGTQAARVACRFDAPHVATGDIFRANVAEGTELGRAAQEYMDRGDLVPDDVVIAMVMERLAERDCQSGFVLDGFPRTVNQAEALDRQLADLGAPLHAVLCFEAAEEELLRRLAGRAATRPWPWPASPAVHPAPRYPTPALPLLLQGAGLVGGFVDAGLVALDLELGVGHGRSFR